jgi:shikimate kinase
MQKRSGVRRPKKKVAHSGDRSVRALFLVGFMGAGKSSVGRALGERLGWSFVDLDERIEKREGRTIAELFRKSGEQIFRRAERAALRELLKELRAGSEMVVALGGGAFVQKENAAGIKSTGVPIVFLDAPAAELWRRCQQQRTQVERPLLIDAEAFQRLYEARRPGYLKASLRMETSSKDAAAVAAEVAKAFDLDRRKGV